MSRRRSVLVGCALLVAVTAITVDGQGRDRRRARGLPDNVEQTGEFVFTRIRYGSSGRGWGFRSSSWSHDYPRADRHLPRILEYLTTTPVRLGESNVFDLDDFEAEQWNNMEAQLRRVLPEHRLIEIDVTHPIYDVFFTMKALDFPHPLVDVVPTARTTPTSSASTTSSTG